MTRLFVCSHSPGKHTAPVWHIRWIEKERGSGDESHEVLISISTDGRVTQWSIRKGFESYGELYGKEKGGAYIHSTNGRVTQWSIRKGFESYRKLYDKEGEGLYQYQLMSVSHIGPSGRDSKVFGSHLAIISPFAWIHNIFKAMEQKHQFARLQSI